MGPPVTAEELDAIIGTVPEHDARILFWDIETAPMECYVFDLKTEYIGHENIKRDWSIFCVGYKWHDRKGVVVECVDPADPFNDAAVVAKIHAVLSQADILVHQNGDRFDLKKFNDRAVIHGLPPLPPIRTVDTLKEARKHLNLSSYRLDYLGAHFGLGRKEDTPRGLWRDCCAGDPRAFAAMRKYNRRDVLLLEQVYYKLRPLVRTHPNLALHTEDALSCPNCGSPNVKRDGAHHTRVNRYRRFRCLSCGAWSRAANKDGPVLR